MNCFYTRLEAAQAIATQLHPDDELLREEVSECYSSAIYDALCESALIGRWPDTRLPIEHPNMRLPAEYRNLAGAIALAGCVISQADLNGWLSARGIGVAINSNGSAEPAVLPAAEEMVPGPERDAAMLAAHTRYKSSGVRNPLARTAAEFHCSKTVVTRAIRREKERLRIAPALSPIAGSLAWNPGY